MLNCNFLAKARRPGRTCPYNAGARAGMVEAR